MRMKYRNPKHLCFLRDLVSLLGATRPDPRHGDALPADRRALDAARGARHVHDRHPARRRRCAARHVCHARRGHRRCGARPDLHLRLRTRARRRGDRDRAVARRASGDRPAWRPSRPPADPAAGRETPGGRGAALLRHRPAGGADADRDARRQHLCHGRDGGLRRPGGGRLGDHRAHRARRLRGDLRPVGRRRPDPRAELRCAQIRPAAVHHARRAGLHGGLRPRRLGAAGAVCRARSPTCSAPTTCRAS